MSFYQNQSRQPSAPPQRGYRGQQGAPQQPARGNGGQPQFSQQQRQPGPQNSYQGQQPQNTGYASQNQPQGGYNRSPQSNQQSTRGNGGQPQYSQQQGQQAQTPTGRAMNGQQSMERGGFPPVTVHLAKSWNGASLLEIQIVSQPPTGKNAHLKSPYFAWITIKPGGKNQKTGERTYIGDNAITMKISFDKLLEIATAIRVCAAGRGGKGTDFGDFTSYTDTSKARTSNREGGAKTLSLKKYDAQGGKPANLMMGLSRKGGKLISYSFSLYEAPGMAKVIEMLAEKGLELDFSRQLRNPRTNSSQQASRQAA